MNDLVLQTLGIILIAFFGHMHSAVGSTMHNRPIIMAPLVGLLLGDLTTGIMVGATLELVWMGAFPIGASNPPDMVSGAIIGAAYVITTGQSIASSVALAVPVATLVLFIDNFCMTIFIPWMAARADAYASKSDFRGIERVQWVIIIGYKLFLAAIVGLGFYFGIPVIEGILATIPDFVMHGVEVATGILPAIGFAMLARMILTKEIAPYLFIGFLAAAYLNLPLLSIALFGTMAAILIVKNEKKEVASDDNEF
jgi:fructoselysine and glucoselysine-specific PTS system IIC component